ncbi:MAG: tetratricopeptide repeat protein [Pseudomonadales bacterium]|nr:tetratricopeptide repeat protein [Pseudomonadales bacterium]
MAKRVPRSRYLTQALGLIVWAVVTPLALADDAPQQREFLESFGGQLGNQQIKASNGESDVSGRDGPVVSQSEQMQQSVIDLPADNALRSARVMTSDEQDRMTVQKGLELIDSGDIDEAMNLLSRFLLERPSAHQSRQTLATIQLASGNAASAQATLKQGLALAPNFAGFKKLYARLVMVVDPEAAVALLDELPPTLEQDPDYFELYAVLLQQVGRYDAALAIYRGLLQMDPASGKLWLAYAVALEATGATEDALAAHRAANRQGLGDPALDRYNRLRLKALRSKE